MMHRIRSRLLDNLHEQVTVRFANFLSPLLQETYEAIASYVGRALSLSVTSGVGQDLTEFYAGQADLGFLCGLQYVRLGERPYNPVELLAAPVLRSERYQQRPIYYSDVIVRRESRYASFRDLSGCTWAYNEEASHSGYNLVQYSLLERKAHGHYFGKTIKSGSHLQSLRLVLEGKADATAIDSHVLDVVLQRDAQLASQVSIIDMFGPSSIPPVVAARRLSALLKRNIQSVLINMHQDARMAEMLQAGGIERFVAVQDEQYDDIRNMVARVQSA
jgi:phosphonate transport system substrate-binding protein